MVVGKYINRQGRTESKLHSDNIGQDDNEIRRDRYI